VHVRSQLQGPACRGPSSSQPAASSSQAAQAQQAQAQAQAQQRAGSSVQAAAVRGWGQQAASQPGGAHPAQPRFAGPPGPPCWLPATAAYPQTCHPLLTVAARKREMMPDAVRYIQ
jgi:hypothetical protein